MRGIGVPGARGIGVALGLALASTPSTAQRVDADHPLTLLVGRSSSLAPSERIDGARRGLSPTALPEGTLRVLWRRTVAPSIEHAPLLTPAGSIVVLTGRGDLVELDPEGGEVRRVPVGVGPLGPGAILADGTVVTMTGNGEAVGIARGAVRFRTRIGERGVLTKVAPLALEDGGVVVAGGSGAASGVATEVAALDAVGQVRARATLPAPVSWPPVATKGGVAFIAADGSVHLWMPGQRPRAAGSFGGALDGGAAARDSHTLVGVVEGRRLVALDLDHADTRVLVTSLGGLLGPPSVQDGNVYVLEATSANGRLLVIDAVGAVASRNLSTLPGNLDGDAGATASRAPVHTATLVDDASRVAFGGTDGHVGVSTPSTLNELGEVVCGRGAPPLGTPPGGTLGPRGGGGPRSASGPRPSAGFAGLVPTGEGAFLVACESGALLQVQGGSAAR